MPDPNLDIKIKVSGADPAATELKKLEKANEQAGRQAEQLTTKKHRLSDALKKLGNQIPGLGYALGTLKNPYVLLAAAIGLALDQLKKFFEEVEKMARAARHFDTLNLSIRDFAEVLAANEADRNKFLRHLDDVANKSKDGAAHLKELNEQIERQFELEDAAAKAAGVDTPEAQAAREQRKRSFKANALFNAGTRARDLADSARAALPGAEAELNAATIAQTTAANLGRAQEALVSEQFGGRAALVEKIRTLEDQQSLAGPGQTVRGLAEARAALQSLDFTDSLLNRNQRSTAERVTRAGERVTSLRGQLSAGTEQFSSLRGQAAGEFRQIDALHAINNPGAAAGAAKQSEVQAAFDAYHQAMIRMYGRAQQEVDAISRNNASQSQSQR